MRKIKDIVLFRLILGEKISAKVTFLEFVRSAMMNHNGVAKHFYDKKPEGYYTNYKTESFIVENDYVSIINWLIRDGYEVDTESLNNIGDGRTVTFMLWEGGDK